MEPISSVSSVDPDTGLQAPKAATVPEGGTDTTKDQ